MTDAIIQSPLSVRSTLPEARHQRVAWKGVAMFIFYASLVIGLFVLLCGSGSLWLLLVGTPLLGLSIGTLFVVGHDACHGALFDQGWMSRLLGAVAFLPSLHLYSTWAVGHNRQHHNWTMLRGRDYVYTPLSPDEYKALSPLRRWIWRFFHTVPGIAFYYLIDIWWKHLIRRKDVSDREMDDREYWLDLLLVVGFVVFVLWSGHHLSLSAGWSQTAALGISVGVFAGAFLSFNWVIAFVTIQHHTHPRARWYAKREEWDFFKGQVCGTVHVKMPVWIGAFFGNILEHTAHHVDKSIPLYNLPRCQIALEQAYPDDVIVEVFTLRRLISILRTCQLYDYDAHRWTEFEK